MKRKNLTEIHQPSRRAWASALILSGVAASGFVFLVAGHTSRITQSHHGLFHSAYVYQMLNGILPPTNPLSIGAGANYVSGYYFILASVAWVFRITVLEASLVVNSAALAVVLAFTWMAAGLYVRNPLIRLASCLVPFAILNPLGQAQFLASFPSALLAGSAMPEFRSPMPGHMAVFATLMSGPIDAKTGEPLLKFLNVSGMPIGVAMFVVSLHLVSTPVRRIWTRAGIGWLAGVFQCFVYPPAALGSSVAGLAAVLVHLREAWQRRRLDAAFWSATAPAFALWVGVALSSFAVMAAARNLGETIHLVHNARTLVWNATQHGWALLPVLTLFIAATPIVAGVGSRLRIHWLAGVLLVGACIFVRNGWSYKFAHYSAYPAALVLLLVARRGFARLRVGWMKPAFTAMLVAAALLPVVATTVLYMRSGWARADPYVYNGRTVDLRIRAREPRWASLRTAYAWLRAETPPTAHVVELPVGANNVLLSVVAQRRVVAARPSYVFTRKIPYQKKLASACEGLVRALEVCEESDSRLDALWDFPIDWPDEIYAIAARRDGRSRCSAPGRGVEIAYQNRHYRVFRIDTP